VLAAAAGHGRTPVNVGVYPPTLQGCLKKNPLRREVCPLNRTAEPSGVAADLKMNPVNFRPELQLVQGDLRDRWFP